MPPAHKPTQSGELSIVVALMESIEGLRSDLYAQTDTINKKLDSQNKELVQKIDANAAEARNEFSELRSDMADMKIRLAEGSERMRTLRRDVDEAKALRGTTALQKKTEEETRPHKKGMPWWLPLLLGGALAFVGEKLARFVINGLADQPVTVTAPIAQPPTPAAPANANSITIDLGQAKQ